MGKSKVKRSTVSWLNEKIISDSVEIECRFKTTLCAVSRKFGRCPFEEHILYRLYVTTNNLASGRWNVWPSYSRFNGNGCECYDVHIRAATTTFYSISVPTNSGCERFCTRRSYRKISICISAVSPCFFLSCAFLKNKKLNDVPSLYPLFTLDRYGGHF